MTPYLSDFFDTLEWAAIGRPRLPLVSKGSLCAPPGTSSHKENQGPHPSRLRRATFPVGEGFGGYGLPHQCAHWFAMTYVYFGAQWNNTKLAVHALAVGHAGLTSYDPR